MFFVMTVFIDVFTFTFFSFIQFGIFCYSTLFIGIFMYTSTHSMLVTQK